MDRLDELEEIAHSRRWHDCSDGYRWRVQPAGSNSTHYIGELLGPGGGQLARIEARSQPAGEHAILRLLARHRAGTA